MADGITLQRGNQYTRTRETTLTAAGALSGTVAAQGVTVTVSGQGAVELTVQCHPAVEQTYSVTDTGGPDEDSPHWSDAAPDAPLIGTIAAGAGLVADYGASGLFWWRVRLNTGGPVVVFMSAAGAAL